MRLPARRDHRGPVRTAVRPPVRGGVSIGGTGALGQVGAACFGITVGYLTYRTLVRTAVNASIFVLAAVVSAVGGAAVTGLFAPGTSVFA